MLAPRAPGVFSALGLAYANVERHLVRTHRVRLRGVTPEELEGSYDSMAEQARSELVKIGWPADAVEIVRYADLRYQGQSSELRIAVDPGTLTAASLSRIEGAFQTEYERTYGHAQEASRAEIASLRVVARIAAESPTLPPINGAWSAAPLARRPAYFGQKLGFIDTRVISRLDLLGQQLAGPLIIEEYDSTVVVPPACTVSMDPRAMC